MVIPPSSHNRPPFRYLLMAGLLIGLFSLMNVQSAGAHDESVPRQEPQISLAPAAQGQRNVGTNRIIIKYRAADRQRIVPQQAQQIQRLNQAGGVALSYLREMSGQAHVLQLPQRLPVDQVQAIANRLSALPEVEYAEPDAPVFHTATPNDTYYSTYQWHYWDTWGINAPAAWDVTTGSSSTVVAVIDTGYTDHPDLASKILPGYDFIGDVFVANDTNGRDADAHDPGDWMNAGECASGDPPFDEPSSWHGTHTAGTVGAVTNNGAGVAGVNWNAKILPVRVLGKCGGYNSDVVDGMRWAAGLSVSGVPANANPAKVLSLSLGGSGSCSLTYQNAINDVTGAGAVVVVAAGNNYDYADYYQPASCNGVITVAATNRNGNKASYSNYGSKVEISAPGGDGSYTNWVLSTLNEGTTVPGSATYGWMAGTSQATPHVSGVVSLMLSRNPSLTPDQVLTILQSTVTHFSSSSTCTTTYNCGSGIINAGAAVNAVPVTAPSISSFWPTSGGVGLPIYVHGAHFTGTTAVTFNGTSATFSVLSDTLVRAPVPAGATNGNIQVTTPLGTATSSSSFTVTDEPPYFFYDMPLILKNQ